MRVAYSGLMGQEPRKSESAVPRCVLCGSSDLKRRASVPIYGWVGFSAALVLFIVSAIWAVAGGYLFLWSTAAQAQNEADAGAGLSFMIGGSSSAVLAAGCAGLCFASIAGRMENYWECQECASTYPTTARRAAPLKSAE